MTSGKKIAKNRKIIRTMLLNAAFGITLMEISGAITYIIDGIITSRYLGSTALAASGMSGICFTLLAIVSGVIAAGSQQVYCDELGDTKNKDKSSTFAKVFTFTAIASVIVALIGIAASGLLASAVGAPVHLAELHTFARNYMMAFFTGAPAHIFSAVLIPAVQLNGDNKIITLSIAVLIISDIVGDLFNVLVVHGGMFGMGLATSLSYYLSASTLLLSFFKKESLFRISIKKPDMNMLRSIFDIGLPRATKRLGNFIRPFFINNLIMIAGGSAAMAAFTVEQNIRYFTESVGVGIGGAAFLLAGIFINEKDPTSLRQTSRESINAVICGVGALAVVYFAAAPLLTKLYLQADSESFEWAVMILRCHAVSLPFLAFNEYYLNIIQAAKKIKLTHLITLLNKLIYIVILSFVLYYIMGITGIWLAIPLSEILLCASIIICNALRSRSNPMRATAFSFIDDAADKSAKQIEISIRNTDDLTHAQTLIIDFCKENRFDEKTSYMIQLFFEEVCMLIIGHGFNGKKSHSIDIRILCNENDIVLRTKDNCKPFNLKERQLMLGNSEEAVYTNDAYMGIGMVTKLAKSVDYINIMNINNFIVVL